MGQEDYLKRQIDQLGRVFGKILVDLLGLKSKGQVNIGIEITNQMLKSELDFDIQELTDIRTSDFINTLLSKKKFNFGNFEKLAEILLLVADNKAEKERKMLYEKCLAIFEYLEETEKVYSLDRQQKMARIK